MSNSYGSSAQKNFVTGYINNVFGCKELWASIIG